MSPRTSPHLNKTMSRTFHSLPAKGQNSSGDISVDGQKKLLAKKKLIQSMIDNQQGWAFKSKEPKVSIYRDEEKRINGLYGSKQGLKYKIKLND